MINKTSFNMDVTMLDNEETVYMSDSKLFSYVQAGLGYDDPQSKTGDAFDIAGRLQHEFLSPHPDVPARVYHIGNATVVATVQRGAAPKNTMLFVDIVTQSHREAEATKNSLESFIKSAIVNELKTVITS